MIKMEKIEINRIFETFTGSILAVSLFILVLMVIVGGNPFNSFIHSSYNEIQSGDYLVDIVAERCNLEDDFFSKAECVNEIFRGFYVYKLRNNTVPIIKEPSDFLVNGGLCRDSTKFYCNVFDKMDIECNSNIVEGHVFNVIDSEEGYCTIDQKIINCERYGEK